ncbi:hypothetical protein A9Q99_15210 [Gammaproteobacteria bacterium 45_16_T64]|nr:hypothetical protein A9Q99_15210 [Gammaproteobacteria bacterium 45_16_T64]
MARRFIAGVVCPECKQMDKIVTYQQDGEDVAECIACGYLSHRPKPEDIVQPQEEDVTGVVKILPNK